MEDRELIKIIKILNKKLDEGGYTSDAIEVANYSGGNDSGCVEIDTEVDELFENNNISQPLKEDFLEYLELNVLDYGSWAGDFNATGRIFWDRSRFTSEGTESVTDYSDVSSEHVIEKKLLDLVKKEQNENIKVYSKGTDTKLDLDYEENVEIVGLCQYLAHKRLVEKLINPSRSIAFEIYTSQVYVTEEDLLEEGKKKYKKEVQKIYNEIFNEYYNNITEYLKLIKS